ncbi:MAG: response regulator [Phenylobacterium sp.]
MTSTEHPEDPGRDLAPDPEGAGATGLPLLLADDDELHVARTTRALEARGFEVSWARSLSEARTRLLDSSPGFLVLEMRLPDGAGLGLIEAMMERRPDGRAVVLTAFGSIANAVAAVKLGAADYLTKPADPDDLAAALLGRPPAGGLHLRPMTADRARWEHIHRVFEFCGNNVSETSRRLGMHRRTLQRILAKHAPR